MASLTVTTLDEHMYRHQEYLMGYTVTSAANGEYTVSFDPAHVSRETPPKPKPKSFQDMLKESVS